MVERERERETRGRGHARAIEFKILNMSSIKLFYNH